MSQRSTNKPTRIDALTLARARAQTLQHLVLDLAPLQSTQQTVNALLRTLTTLEGHPHGTVAMLDWENRVIREVWAFAPPSAAPTADDKANIQTSKLTPAASLDTLSPWAEVARSGAGVAIFGSPETILPLPGRQQAQGVVLLVYGSSHTSVDADEQTFLLSLAGLGGQALDRAVMLEVQQASHTALEEKTQQLEERNLELHGFTHALAENLGKPLERIHGFLKLAVAALGEDIPVRARRLFTCAV